MKIAYDVGANSGQNLSYYLKKFDLVVAIEANPVLCDKIESYGYKNVVVERCAVSDFVGETKFKISKNPVLSQLGSDPPGFIREEVVRVRTLSSIIRQYGDPYYIKIDVEHHDHIVLNDLLSSGIYSPYISCELHRIEVVESFLRSGRYLEFKIVDGRSVPHKYSDVLIHTVSGDERFSFLDHSAGPFWDDILGGSFSLEELSLMVKKVGLGWRDLHAKLAQI